MFRILFMLLTMNFMPISARNVKIRTRFSDFLFRNYKLPCISRYVSHMPLNNLSPSISNIKQLKSDIFKHLFNIFNAHMMQVHMGHFTTFSLTLPSWCADQMHVIHINRYMIILIRPYPLHLNSKTISFKLIYTPRSVLQCFERALFAWSMNSCLSPSRLV